MKGRSRFRFRYRGIMSALGGIIDTTSKLLLDLFANDFEVANEVSTFNQTIGHSASTNATMTSGYGPNIVAGQTWTISDPAWTDNGDGSFTGVSASGFTLEVAGILEANKVYQVEFEIYDYVSGTLDVRVGNSSPAGVNATSNGTYTVLQPQSGNLHFYLFPVSAFTGSVRNISVREMPAIKWRPHNLLTYSEDFTQSAYVKDPGVSIGTTNNADPSGGTSATQINVTDNGRIYRNEPAVPAKAAIFIKAGTFAHFKIAAVSVDLVAKTASAGTLTELDNGWFLFVGEEGTLTRPFQIQAYPDNTYSIHTDSGNYYIWGAHLYRSDLGGMVDNPDRGDSYVPTTSSAVYLPRRGHHIYNGYEWVNEGMLHESEARTNLFEDSEDFNASSWGFINATAAANQAIAPDGTNSATKLIPTATNAQHVIYPVINTGSYPTTISIYAKAAGYNYLSISSNAADPNSYANFIFNLQEGTVSDLNVNIVIATATASIEDVGNGWYRCSYMAENLNTTFFPRIIVYETGTISPGYFGGESFAGDGTSGVYIWGAQSEAASTPSSYIPTSGATVTRAAESLTIPAANLPWPTPNVIGSELVTNGTFDTDTDWTKAAGWTISGGVATSDGTAGSVYQSAITVGKVYSVTWEITSISSGAFVVNLGGGNLGTPRTSVGTYTDVVTAGDAFVRILSQSGVGSIDNVSVKEIDPLAVSIQMNGRMTYADNNAVAANFVYWRDTLSNRIEIDYYAYLADQIRAVQVEGGTVDILGISSALQPGVFVPFNIASRHGSTFVNIAVDGIAATADTTPTALPDLSATDLNLGYDFMGTIQNFQIWDRDIGDQGLVDETAPSLEPSLFLTFDGTTGSYTVRDWSE